MPSRSHSMTRLSILPLFSRSGSLPEYLFLDLILFGYHLDEELHCRPLPTDCDVVAVHGRHDGLPLDAASPHAGARKRKKKKKREKEKKRNREKEKNLRKSKRKREMNCWVEHNLTWTLVLLQLIPSAVHLKIAETEQLYQGTRMIAGIGDMLFSIYSQT